MSQPGVEIGSGMPSSPLPGLSSALPVMTISWHGAFSTTRGGIGFCAAAHPARVDLLERAADADAVDFAVGGEPADQHRDVVLAALAVDDVGEQERLAVLLLDAAAELPAHQRVHLGVLVDRPVDRDQQPGLVERADVVVQVGIGARAVAPVSALRLRLGDGVHGAYPCWRSIERQSIQIRSRETPCARSSLPATCRAAPCRDRSWAVPARSRPASAPWRAADTAAQCCSTLASVSPGSLVTT